jgi:predicted  nucleic acid-binding Zn-ribbon protein
MNEAVKQLLSLQSRDLEIDNLKADLASVPKSIESAKKQIIDAKQALEDSKKELTHLQMVRREKEADLEGREAAIRKHTTELNSIKSNEAYKALLVEIDKAKQDKSVLEDGVLELMVQIDAANRVWKEREAAGKVEEGKLLGQVAALETKQKDLEQQLAQKQSERQEASGQVAKAALETYERIRNARGGAAVVPIHKEQCTGCHLKVSPNFINQLGGGHKMMVCESCSRIVYLEEAPKASEQQAVPEVKS